MAKTHIKSLQDAAKEVAAGQNPQEKIELLTKAFELFSEETKRLESAYSELKQQHRELSGELSETNRQLSNKLLELDTVTYYLNSIVSNISQGLLFIDFNGCITTYNATAEKILGIPSEKVLFNSFWTHFEDSLLGFSMREILSQRRAPSKSYASLEKSPSEKRELEVDATMMLRKGENKGAAIDAMQGMIVLLRDITEERRLQLVAARNDRLRELGEMAAMVAHEIRNPLSGIKGFASLLQRDLKDRPELQQMAHYIIEGTDNLNRLVTTVLNYARPVKPQIEWIDLSDLGRELQQHLEADSSIDPRIKITFNMPTSSILAPLDGHLIKSALLNLIVNAIQAMPEGGKLTINFFDENGEAVLVVSDTGIGISPENIGKLYAPFFTTRANGNGFGLAEVLKIVQAHGGKIDVDSHVGQGTTFSIKIPLERRG